MKTCIYIWSVLLTLTAGGATTNVWTGVTGFNWASDANWDVAPVWSDDSANLVFSTAASGVALYNNVSGAKPAGIIFAEDLTADCSVNGSSITLKKGDDDGSIIVHNSTYQTTFNNGLVFSWNSGAQRTIRVNNGDLRLGNITLYTSTTGSEDLHFRVADDSYLLFMSSATISPLTASGRTLFFEGDGTGGVIDLSSTISAADVGGGSDATLSFIAKDAVTVNLGMAAGQVEDITLQGATINWGDVDMVAGDVVFGEGDNELAFNGFDNDFGNLALDDATGSNVLDFAGGDSAVVFADSSGLTWQTGLTIINFDAGDSVRFGTDAEGLTSAQLAQITVEGAADVYLDSNGFLTVIMASEWTRAVDNNWATAGNWTVVPENWTDYSANLVFGCGDGANYWMFNNIGTTRLAGMRFTADAVTNYSVNNNAIEFADGDAKGNVIIKSGAHRVWFNNQLVFNEGSSADRFVRVDSGELNLGDVVFAAGTAANPNLHFQAAGGANVVFRDSGTITLNETRSLIFEGSGNTGGIIDLDSALGGGGTLSLIAGDAVTVNLNMSTGQVEDLTLENACMNWKQNNMVAGDLILGEGTNGLALNGFDNGFGTLTIADASGLNRLDFADGDSAVAFVDSSSLPWQAGLAIINFDAEDSIRFGTDANGLTSAQLSMITINGRPNVRLDSNGFLVIAFTTNEWTRAVDNNWAMTGNWDVVPENWSDYSANLVFGYGDGANYWMFNNITDARPACMRFTADSPSNYSVNNRTIQFLTGDEDGNVIISSNSHRVWFSNPLVFNRGCEADRYVRANAGELNLGDITLYTGTPANPNLHFQVASGANIILRDSGIITLDEARTLVFEGSGSTGGTIDLDSTLDGSGSLSLIAGDAVTMNLNMRLGAVEELRLEGAVVNWEQNRMVTGDAVFAEGANKLAFNGFDNDFGTLAVTDASGVYVLDFSGGDSLVVFDESSGLSWQAGLTITNFETGDSLRFGTDATGLTASQLAQITVNGNAGVSLNANGFLVPSSGYTPPENLLSNGDFEQGLTGWNSPWAPDGNITVELSTSEKYSGTQAALIEYEGTQNWTFAQSQPLAVTPGEIFRLLGWVRVPEGAVRVAVILYDGNDEAMRWAYGGPLFEVGDDWQSIDAQFAIPNGCESMRLYLSGTGAATIYADSLSLTREGNLNRQISLPATPLSVENDQIRMVFSSNDGTCSLHDKRTGETWEPMEQVSTAKDERFIMVLNAEETASGVEEKLIEPETMFEFFATWELAASAAEVSVEVEGTGALPANFGYPYAFVSAADRINDWLVMPVNEGIAYPIDDDTIPATWYPMYSGHGLCMGWCGVADLEVGGTGDGLMMIVETPNDATIATTRKENRLCLAPKWISEKGQFGPNRKMRYILFDEGGYVAMCKRYRTYAQEVGLFKTLEQKRQENPNVDLLVGAVNVWCWEENPAAYCTELQSLGISRILWSRESESDEIRQMNELGVLAGRYDVYQDCMDPANFPMLYDVPDVWTSDQWPDGIIINEDGDWARGWEVDGKDGETYACGRLCDRLAPDYARNRIAEDLQTHSYGARFVDTSTAMPWVECYASNHPMTRTESREYRMELLDVVSREFNMVTGSETGHEASVPYLHYFEGMLSLGPYRSPDAGRSMMTPIYDVPERVETFQTGHWYRIPLFELVYHDCIVSTWYWGDYNNKLPPLWDRRDLFNLLYNTPAMFMFNPEIWEENRERFVQSYRTTHQLPRETGYAEMLSHRWLTADHAVQETSFANGVRVTVNFGDTTYTTSTGIEIAPLGYVVNQNGGLIFRIY